MRFLEAILDRAHEEHREMLVWPGGPFEVNEAQARSGLTCMARRRRGELASHRSRSRHSKR